MGQAFRRATGSAKIRAPTTIRDPLPSSGPSNSKTPINHSPTTVVGSTDSVKRAGQQIGVESSEESPQQVNEDNLLEEKDPKYDAMLNQMFGRIKTKPGGKPKMGEAFVVQKSSRPMPKLRNTTTDTGRYESRPPPPGTLNVLQLRHILLLHQGKADDHVGPMEADQIAAKYRIDVAVIQNILQFQSLPPEDPTKQKIYEAISKNH